VDFTSLFTDYNVTVRGLHVTLHGLQCHCSWTSRYSSRTTMSLFMDFTSLFTDCKAALHGLQCHSSLTIATINGLHYLPYGLHSDSLIALSPFHGLPDCEDWSTNILRNACNHIPLIRCNSSEDLTLLCNSSFLHPFTHPSVSVKVHGKVGVFQGNSDKRNLSQNWVDETHGVSQ
jgi:hypothetical protein